MTIFLNSSKPPFNFNSEFQGLFAENNRLFEEELKSIIKELQELDYDEAMVYLHLVLTYQDLSFEKVQKIFHELKIQKTADSIFKDLFSNDDSSEVRSDDDQKIELMKKWLKEDSPSKMPFPNFDSETQVNNLSSDNNTTGKNSCLPESTEKKLLKENNLASNSLKKSNHKWTEEENAKMLEMIQNKLTIQAMYDILNKQNNAITYNSVRSKYQTIVKANNIPYKNYKWEKKENDQMLELIRRGWKSHEIYDFFKKRIERITLSSVENQVNRLKKKSRENFFSSC